METKVKTSIQLEKEESFIKLSKSLIETKHLGKNGEVDIYYLAVIKSMANNFQGFAYTGVNHLMKFLGMSTGQSSTKLRTKASLLRLQQTGHIEIYESINGEMSDDLKHANNYFIKPTGKDEEFNFAKIHYKDIQKIVMLKSDYKPKIFAVYLNMVGYIYYTISNKPMSYVSIDTVARNTKINRKSVIDYLKVLHEKEILYFVHFKINNTTVKNYCTRWIHKEYTAAWGSAEAEYQYKIAKEKFKSGGVGVSEE
ncbi:hypothetical protein [Planococcus salinarum]|uniref:hypothetical protein n=1 Tax=Planococcus salinarum TaxID=622695 RepID=UPI000E3B7B8E|nr:hypothetical protein [Planococcus salinarum]TAA71935.1 hypothetical protein D2909_08920 [Planococcus salinarum]